jgi:hypothetical protein
MTKIENAKLPWECTLGNKSHLNIVGKVLLFPMIVIVCGVISLGELFLTKYENE